MEVVVDGSSGWITPEEGAKLGKILDDLRTQISNKRRAVASVRLDDEDLNRERQEQLADKPVGEFGLLEVRTLDPFELSLNTLFGLNQHLDNMVSVHTEAAQLVRAGEYDKALEKLEGCFTGWEVILHAVRDIGRLTGAKLGELTAGERTVEQSIKRLQSTLLKFRTAFEVKDVVTVGDVAEHELAPAISEWKGVIQSLSAHVGRLSGAAE